VSEALCAGLKADQAENRAETRSAEGTPIVRDRRPECRLLTAIHKEPHLSPGA